MCSSLRECRNVKSVCENINEVNNKINKELLAGRIMGPSATPITPNIRCSPLELVSEKAPAEFRLIYHLPCPEKESVNDYMNPKMCSVKYASFMFFR